MEENEPLLEGSPSLSQLNLVTTLRGDFVSKLPERVLSGLDPSSPHHFDISKATGLTEG